MDNYAKSLLQYYKQGFKDELNNTSRLESSDEFRNKAYKIGANHAQLGDDNRNFDYLTDEEILKLIKHE